MFNRLYPLVFSARFLRLYFQFYSKNRYIWNFPMACDETGKAKFAPHVVCLLWIYP